MSDNFVVQPLEPLKWHHHPKLWIVCGVLVLLVVSIFIMLSGEGFAQEKIRVEISAPTEISGGDLVVYKIKISNGTKLPLEESRLTIYYPNQKTPKTITVGTMAKSSSQEFTEQVYVTGAQGEVKNFKADFYFMPSGLSSSFQKSAEAVTTITRLRVPLTVVAPPTAVSGETITYIVDYRNQSNEEFIDLKLRAKYPDGFTIKSQNPRPQTSLKFERIDEWILPRLTPGDSGRITVIGTLSGRQGEGKLLSVVLQRKINGEYIDFESYETASIISSPLLSASITVNRTNDYIAHLGDTLSYSILVENNSDTDLTSLVLRARLDGAMIDFTTVKSSGYLDTRSKTVSWNSAAAPELALLRAHGSAQIPLEVKLLKSFPNSSIGARDSLVSMSIDVETDQVPAQLAGAVVSAQDSIITKISTAPSFSQELSLAGGGTTAQGPFPPKVGQKTFYVVRWSVINPANELKTAKISATVLPGVDVAGILQINGTTAAPVYDARTQTMTWSIGSIAGGVGVAFPPIELWFQIYQTPSVNQVGSPVELLKNIAFEATDALTAEKFAQTGRDVSTRDVSDSKESGNVQP